MVWHIQGSQSPGSSPLAQYHVDTCMKAIGVAKECAPLHVNMHFHDGTLENQSVSSRSLQISLVELICWHCTLRQAFVKQIVNR